MKTCARCKECKPHSEFNRSSKNKDGLHSYCRDCHKAHYRSNYERHYRNVRRTAVLRLAHIRSVVYEHLKQGCVDCGFSDIRALQFDHVRGTKVMAISTMIRRGASLRTIESEIAKCEVRCANCHMIETVKRREHDWHNAYLNGPPGGI
ncbi:hypothetical protein [Gryllotalpicola ginsengisoli]|uniref:hypothetical protein n=1 Tax=Gryllotalpicola ginsengisoli TaxID=444608 RepID=UPI00047F75F1|nr:hypothetical protein [Gryllotalpicola ginsengisoli]